MWFKNLQTFLLKEPFEWTPEALGERLEAHRFHPCAAQEPVSQGWTAPTRTEGAPLVASAHGFHLICLRREEKLLPASVVNDVLAERVEAIEAAEGRPPRRKERIRLKEDIFQELLPRAFSRNTRLYACIDPQARRLLVDTPSATKAEDLVSLLRKGLGSLPARPLAVNRPPVDLMTRWLQGEELPRDLEILDQCELREPGEEGGIVRCRRQDLFSDEVRAHLDAGKQVVQLALEWEERLGFVLTDPPAFKRLRFDDLVLEEAAEAGGDDEAARLDADLALMGLELQRFLDRMLELMGGPVEG